MSERSPSHKKCCKQNDENVGQHFVLKKITLDLLAITETAISDRSEERFMEEKTTEYIP